MTIARVLAFVVGLPALFMWSVWALFLYSIVYSAVSAF